MTNLNLRTTILPSAYEQIEYISTDGSAYIDTGLTKGTGTFTANIDLAIVSTSASTGRQAFAGADWGVSSHMTFNASTKRFDVQDIYPVPYTTTLGTRYQVEAIFSTSNVVMNLRQGNTLLGTVTRPNMSWTSSNTNTFLIGYIHNPSSNITITQNIYGAKIYQDSTLVRNYIPAKRNHDSVVGMYDLVTCQFYTSAV